MALDSMNPLSSPLKDLKDCAFWRLGACDSQMEWSQIYLTLLSLVGGPGKICVDWPLLGLDMFPSTVQFNSCKKSFFVPSNQ